MFSWPLRIAGWIIGIYALLKLATVTGTVTYTKVFQAWLDQLRDYLDLGFILKPLKQAVILPALDFIRSFDIPIPPLQDHWQQVFVLTWLLSAAMARHLSSFGVSTSVSTPVALLTGFLCTLPFCIATGTVPVGSWAVLFWPAAGFIAFGAVLALLRGDGRRVLQGTALAAALAAAGFFFGTTGEGMWALLVLAAIVGYFGLGFLFLGLRDAEGNIWQRLQHPSAAVGLDVTAAMLGAFGLATVFADPPLF
ncbi:MAG: hypothetical protein ACK55V_09365 [Alphaproteobacteria bacterium]|jgi:hypothetical protein